MQVNEVTFRDATNNDLEALTVLMNHLSYPTTLAEMEARFKNIIVHPDYKTILAVVNGEVVGMAGLLKGIFYERNGKYMRILAFVVKQGRRELGIGKLLIQACEAWAREQGLPTVLISSGNRDDRLAAHAFYKKMGYTVKSSGFVKELVSG